MSDWEARGPDEFGDFHIYIKGEELAKCVVIENGFRSREETKSIATQLIKAVNRDHHFDALVKALENLLSAYHHSRGDEWVDAAYDALSQANGVVGSSLGSGK